MRALGLHCTSQYAFLALVESGRVQDGLTERLAMSQQHEADQRLWATLDDFSRCLDEADPAAMGLLLPETTSRQTHEQATPRIVLETLARLAAAQRGVPLERLHRRTVRSRLGLPSSGPLKEHVATVFPEPCGRHWAEGRGLAALAAKAAGEVA